MKYLKLAMIFILLIFICFISTSCDSKEGADLVLLNGKITTMDKNLPEAEAIAIEGDTILAVGTNKEIEKLIGDNTEVIELDGKFAMPGFYDSHLHFYSLGALKLKLDLRNAEKFSDIVQMVADEVKKKKPGEWIIGRSWHQEKWKVVDYKNVDGFPTSEELDLVSPDNPVLLTHASGHCIIANKKAMELAGITKDTKAPEGGEIVKDKNGNPTGIFKEDASSLIYYAYNKYLEQRTPEQVKKEDIQVLKFADEECLANGITSVSDAGCSFSEIDLYKELFDRNELNVRINAMIFEGNEDLKKRISDYKINNYANNHLKVNSIKRYIDGALGSRSAWFFEPYNDKPTDRGINVTDLDYLTETAKIAIENDFQLCTHAIGDRANKEMLDIYEKVMKQYPDKKDLRWRIEHAQHLAKNEVKRFNQLGVIAAMQGCHATSDAPYIVKRLGEKRGKAESYIWRDLLDEGTIICNGTDAPVELVSPILCFYSSVTRKLSDGTEFTPEQKMTRMEALESYTINSAYASFEENIKGSITPGKLADIIILSKDLLNCPDEDILKTEILYTIIGGKILYKK